MIKIISATIFLSLTNLAWSYGDLGHKTVAAIAWQHLTPYAKQNVQRILGSGVEKFIESSVWADRVKRDERFSYLKSMHYVNMPKNANRYDKARDCKKDKCVVEGIKTFSKVAKNGSRTEQILALRMIVHLVADVHQPLHAGLYEDRGGNWYEIKYQDDSLSLHKFWDHQLVERMGEDWQSISAKILQNNLEVAVGSPETWAEESHGLTVNFLYQAAENKPVTEAYLKLADDLTEQQLGKAGWRLAMWLNKLW